MWVSEFYPKENFNDRKTALGIPEILYKVIYSRPGVARTAAASSATSGREQHESRPRVADFFLAWRMTRSEYSQRFRAYLRWIFSRVWPTQYSSPSLCEQSELQCFASDLRRMFA